MCTSSFVRQDTRADPIRRLDELKLTDYFFVDRTNSSTVRPAARIRLLRVPGATLRWFGIESVAQLPSFTRIKWLPFCRTIYQPSRLNVDATRFPLRTGRAAISDGNFDLLDLDRQRKAAFRTNLEAKPDCLANVFESLLLGLTLAYAARNRRTFCNPSTGFVSVDGDGEFHSFNVGLAD